MKFIDRKVVAVMFCISSGAGAQSVLKGDQSEKSFRKLEQELQEASTPVARAAILTILALRDPKILLAKSPDEHACERYALHPRIELDAGSLPKILSRCGQFLFENEKFEEARSLFTELAKDPAFQEFSALQIGWTYMNQRDFKSAFESFLAGIEKAPDGPLRGSLLRDLMRAWTEGGGLNEKHTQTIASWAKQPGAYNDLLSGFKRSLSIALAAPAVAKKIRENSRLSVPMRAIIIESVTANTNFAGRKSCDVLDWIGPAAELKTLSVYPHVRNQVLEKLQTCKIFSAHPSADPKLVQALENISLTGEETFLLSDLYLDRGQLFRSCALSMQALRGLKTQQSKSSLSLEDRVSFCLAPETMEKMGSDLASWIIEVIGYWETQPAVAVGEQVLALLRTSVMKQKPSSERINFATKFSDFKTGFKDNHSYFVWAEILSEIKEKSEYQSLATEITAALLKDPKTPQAAADIPLIMSLAKQDYFIIWERYADVERLITRKVIPKGSLEGICDPSLLLALEDADFRSQLAKNSAKAALDLRALSERILQNSKWEPSKNCVASPLNSTMKKYQDTATSIAKLSLTKAGPRLLKTLERLLPLIERLRQIEFQLAARHPTLKTWSAHQRMNVMRSLVSKIDLIEIPNDLDVSSQELWRQEMAALRLQLSNLTAENPS